jgi:formylglycine-generating enzyme required for sulfatase activity
VVVGRNRQALTVEGRVLKPSPVGAYAAADSSGPFGTEDQAGNVWNWTSTLYKDYPYNAEDGREDPNAEGDRVVRGGSWDNYHRVARCAYRYRNVPVLFGGNFGFRLLSPVSLSP